MANESKPQNLFVFSLASAILLAWLVYVENLYPYYFTWDMDLLTVEDFLLVGSGHMPDHQVHPGVGMLYLLQLLAPIAKWLGVLSASNLTDMSVSANPIMIMADVTYWVRGLTPYIIFAIGLALSTTLTKIYRLSVTNSVSVLTLFCLAVYTSIHLCCSRTEQYSMLFLVIAWCCLLVGAKSLRFIFVAGIFVGLAFFTKMQSLVLVATTFLIAFNYFENTQLFEHHAGFIKTKFFKFVIYGNLLVFCLLSFFSYVVRVTESIHHMRDGFGVTPWWLAIFIFVLASAAIVKFKPTFLNEKLKVPFNEKWLVFIAVASVLITGILGSLLVHLFLYNDIFLGLRHMLLTFKICMLGKFVPATLEQLSEARGPDQYFKHKMLIAFYFGVLLLLIKNWQWRFKSPRFLATTSALLVWAFLLIHTLKATRNLTGTDFIWVEAPILFLGLYFICQIYSNKKWGTAVITVVTLIYAAHGFLTSTTFAPRARFGWTSESMYYKNGYGGNQDKIKDMMDARYDSSVQREKLSARIRHPHIDWHNWRMTVFDKEAPLQGISVIQPGLTVLQNDHDWRIDKIANEWLNASTFDVASATPFSKNRLFQFWVENLSYRPPREPIDDSSLLIAYRNDTRVALLVEDAEFNRLCELFAKDGRTADCGEATMPATGAGATVDANVRANKYAVTLRHIKTAAEKPLRAIYLFNEKDFKENPFHFFKLNKAELKGIYFLALIDYPR